mmetsp:Transcript_25734/g.25006  ORF Transcript_25734/g.25006 Transcript_25734/m.25006 type:complete len:128 (+) Transcript_25734:310-693(+)
MSFKGENTCATGLNSIIFYAYEAYTYREFYIPSNTMGFAIATEKLTESYNSIYAFCDFDHLWNIISQLISFTDWTALGQLGCRIIGELFGVIQDNYRCITEGARSGNYYDVGYCSGVLISVTLDTTL